MRGKECALAEQLAIRPALTERNWEQQYCYCSFRDRQLHGRDIEMGNIWIVPLHTSMAAPSLAPPPRLGRQEVKQTLRKTADRVCVFGCMRAEDA